MRGFVSVLFFFILFCGTVRADVVASLRTDVRSEDASQLAGWSFQWNPTGIELGQEAAYEEIAVGSGDNYRIADYAENTLNYTNSVGSDLSSSNKILIYDRDSDSAWWMIGGRTSDLSTDGLDHYLILSYTIQEGEAGDLRARTYGSNSAASKMRFYVNDTLIYKQDFTSSLNENMIVDLGELTVGDTVHIAFTSDASIGRNSRRWYGYVEIAHRAHMTSLDTGYTIQKVRTATVDSGTLIVGSAYDGEIIGMTYDGTALWTNTPSEYMVHDLWCADITGDNSDEIFAANADGQVYCLDGNTGTNLWQFAPNDGGHLAPMYAVCAIRDTNDTPYVVCGGMDLNVYYLSADGALVKTLDSHTYGIEKPWGDLNYYPKSHIANFLRPVPHASGYDRLAVAGLMNHMQSAGTIYLFEPLADTPYFTEKVSGMGSTSDFRVIDPEGDGTPRFIMGDTDLGDQAIALMDPEDGSETNLYFSGVGENGYRLVQGETIGGTNDWQYFLLTGTYIVLADQNLNVTDKFGGNYAYNDMWKDDENNKILLASAQDGGSCIHLIDLDDSEWSQAFMDLEPPGKIATLLENHANVWTNLTTFSAPEWERDPDPVYLSAASRTHPTAAEILAEGYESPVFLNSVGGAVESTNWRYAAETYLSNDVYRVKVDDRMSHTLTQQEAWDKFEPEFEGESGLSYWAGHGNDPYYYQPETHMGVVDLAAGKKTVMIWPEMNGSSSSFQFVMDDLFYPLAAHAATRNGNIHIRNKDIFWLGAVYLPQWSRLVSGEFSNVFVTSMEETTDKTQDLSVVGRMGIWASGALDCWGIRCSRDNPSFDRSRQHSYQMLSDHFLRTMVYNLANGATHMQNTYWNVDHMSQIWKLIATGALYVPKREEIVSFNPVHLSMTDPDTEYIRDGELNKWSVFYDQEFEQDNPMVFSHMDGTWMAAPVTEWDFSRYAAGVKDRRQNFMPPFPYGTVLVTPPQAGAFSDPDAWRSPMENYLHPLYENILQEFITNGRSYLSPDGTVTNAADTYYTTVAAAIAEAANELPLTVTGDVAWACAQTADRHLRLTLVDNGYINPQASTAIVSFHTVTPVTLTDVLTGEIIALTDLNNVTIDIPLGSFRFIDIELSADFYPETRTSWKDFKYLYGLTGETDADYDGDGETDFYEYALGGHPKKADQQAAQPWLQISTNGVASYYFPERVNTPAGLSYIPQWTADLVDGPWNITWDSLNYTSSDTTDLLEAEHQLDTTETPNLFFRLKITQP